MRSALIILAVVCFIENGAAVSGTFRMKGGIQKLVNTVVDVIVSEKNIDDEFLMNNRKESSDGSGFIVDEKGYIVTNCHVISNADKIRIIVYDGSEYIAKVVGRDDRSDIALLKIDPNTKLPAAVFADSDKVEITDPVIAIGNPFGFGKTVTSGIISYKGRNLSDQIAELGTGGDLVNYLQTDAYVNYGNSGGPLFSYNGEVVGMITVFLTDGAHSAGINFAIPANTLKKVISQLRKYGKMQRSWIGISVSPLDKQVALALGLGKRIGYVVSRVAPDSPASKTGIQTGDILLAINEESFTENSNLEYMLSNLPIKTVSIQIMKHGVERKYSITVDARSDDDLDKYDDGSTVENKKDIPYEMLKYVGIGVTNLTSDLRKSLNIPENMRGVLISRTEDETKLNQENVIITVNQKNISTVEELKKELEVLISNKKTQAVFYIYDNTIGRYDYVAVNLKNI